MHISKFMLIGVFSLLARPVLADEAPVRDLWRGLPLAAQADMLRPEALRISPSFSDRFPLSTKTWLVAEQTPPAEPAPQKAATAAEQTDNSKERVAAAQAKLAWELIAHASKDGNADSTISPASLASAFANLAKGADAKMKAAIATTMGFDTADTAKNLAALTKARAALAAVKGDLLQSADRIVLDTSATPPRHLAARLKNLGVDFTTEDLSKPEAVAKIDAWVKEVTQGAIPEILGEPLDNASFVVLNALHFKGQWKTPFDPRLTTQEPFQSADGTNGEVAMMRLAKAPRAYRTDDTFMGIDLPFSNERFSMVVVTTTDKPAGVQDFAATKDWLSGAGFAERKGDLLLPRFKMSERSELLPALDALGLDKGRHSPTALTRFGKAARLTSVVQHATIEVDETGATAAAATAIIGRRAVDDSLHMAVDKPFIFALRDHETGLILVAGYVGHAPSDQAAK
jgi:serine protease inhibitor